MLAALLVKYPDLQQWAKRAFITYLKSINIQKDKEIFDLLKLPIDEYSASLGLPITPKTRFISQKNKSDAVPTKPSLAVPDKSPREVALKIPSENLDVSGSEEDEEEEKGLLLHEEEEKGLLLPDDSSDEKEEIASEIVDVMYVPSHNLLLQKKRVYFTFYVSALYYTCN